MTPTAVPPTSVRVRVPGKINLYLSVGDVRPDGYHDLFTVFHAVDLYDEVVARPGHGLQLTVTGEGADGVPIDERNLAWRAASLLADHAQVPPHACLDIAKSIPVAAGMAGGSADAAATLVACAELWGLRMDKSDLLALAPRLGADVAFALQGGTAVGTGIGDQLAPVLTTGTFHWVLALSDKAISASDAYRELDRQRARGVVAETGPPVECLMDALREGNAEPLADNLGNELERPALALLPELERTLLAGDELGALARLVSGSGPTCVFLARDADHAAHLARGLAKAGVCRATHVVTGPVPGARIVR
jgi:4-diphosphocytidyl-2-C-methyl-D-erythritol kinase